MSCLLDRMGPVVDVLVLMTPGVKKEQEEMDDRVSDFVRDVFGVCADRCYDPPRVLWCADAQAMCGYVVMDARLDKDTMRKLWGQGRVFGQTYRISSPKERRELEAWMAGRAQESKWG